jgi:hypothetical protein
MAIASLWAHSRRCPKQREGKCQGVGEFLARAAVRLTFGLVIGAVLACNSGNLGSPSTAKPTRSPTSPPPVAVQPSVNPTPTGDTRLESLWVLISDPGLSYHLSGTGVNKNNGSVFERFTLELDVSGDNYAGRVNSIGSSGKAQLVRHDGVMYARPAGGSWVARRMPSDSVLQFVPFLDIRARDDLRADGVEPGGGRQTLYRYVSTSQYRPDVAHMMDLSRFSGRCDVLQLELLVTDAAVPVSAHFECQINNDVYSGVSDYKFTAFGKAFSIKAPIKPPS